MPPRQAKSLVTGGSNHAPHGQPGHVHQSGDDWGMEDLDDYFGNDPMNMDPDSPEFAAWLAQHESEINTPNPGGASTSNYQNEEPPKIPGEVDSQGWSSDFTDSGIQTETDQPMSMEEIIYDQTGPDAPPDEDVPGVKGWKKKLAAYNQRGKGKGQFASGKSTAMNPVLRRGIEAKRTLITG